MIKSNINITSNIYIRKNNSVMNDSMYVKKITGRKLLKQVRDLNLKLTPIQQRILDESVPCSHAKNKERKERTHGAVSVNGDLVWSCRCEQKQCESYKECMQSEFSMEINRKRESCKNNSDSDSLKEFTEKLGIIIENDEVYFEHDKNPVFEEENVAASSEPQEFTKHNLNDYRYHEIDDPSCIIETPLESHIILNSGPGTGKTYTIIQRLIYILKMKLCDAEEIYILCYTRSTKKVIEDKLKAAVERGELAASALNICLLTFDSYATYFLMEMKEQGVIGEDFSSYDYNERIALFNKYITADDLGHIKYFIVDEIQDLVNERAKMVLKMLELLNCGYLMAGDRCQAIYDYSADGDAEIDSVRFYKRAEEIFPADIMRYEMAFNRRQIKELADESKKMRDVLLHENCYEQNRYVYEITKRYNQNIGIRKYIRENPTEISGSVAILCRNNIQAEYVSGLLCERRMNHTLNRGVDFVQSLPRWIADVFWDECQDIISKNDFLDRFNFRCHSEKDPQEMWKLICSLSGNDEQNPQELNLPALVKQLVRSNDVPDEIYEDKPSLTVSTIHKAKGSEFDKVILLTDGKKLSSDPAEEARVQYVALTRPRKKLTVIKCEVKYSYRLSSNRVAERIYHNGKNTYCKSIAVGLNGDIDCSTFVSGDFKNVLNLQEYISTQISLYDKLTVKYSKETHRYEIFHNGNCIGTFSAQLKQELIEGINRTSYKNNLPSALKNLYVGGITTEILKSTISSVPLEYQKSRICYGVRVTGLAQLVFEKKR